MQNGGGGGGSKIGKWHLMVLNGKMSRKTQYVCVISETSMAAFQNTSGREQRFSDAIPEGLNSVQYHLDCEAYPAWASRLANGVTTSNATDAQLQQAFLVSSQIICQTCSRMDPNGERHMSVSARSTSADLGAETQQSAAESMGSRSSMGGHRHSTREGVSR